MCKEVSDVCILHATWAGTNTAHPTLINTYASEQNQANKGKPRGKKKKRGGINKGYKYITMKGNVQSGKLHNRKDTLPVTRSRDQDPHDAPGALHTKPASCSQPGGHFSLARQSWEGKAGTDTLLTSQGSSKS